MKGLVLAFALMIIVSIRGLAFNVFMVGDSHVSSRIYPERVGDILVDADPEINFSYWGKAGASFESYNGSPEFMQKIFVANPDILIVHLGTNDSYTFNFNRQKFLSMVGEFYEKIRNRLSQCKIVFVTPFFNKIKGKSDINRNTRVCADAILEFSNERPGTFVIDNNASHGMFFLNNAPKLINRDNVHLTVEGYQALGDQVGQALIDIDDLWSGLD